MFKRVESSRFWHFYNLTKTKRWYFFHILSVQMISLFWHCIQCLFLLIICRYFSILLSVTNDLAYSMALYKILVYGQSTNIVKMFMRAAEQAIENFGLFTY